MSRQTCSDRAGLKFPVGRIDRMLKTGKFADRISRGASVYMSSVLEYLTEEVLDLAHEVAHAQGKTRIIPRHIELSIRGDDELRQLFAGVTISEGGVIPHIAAVLIQKDTE